jgi:hypothetical protein
MTPVTLVVIATNVHEAVAPEGKLLTVNIGSVPLNAEKNERAPEPASLITTTLVSPDGKLPWNKELTAVLGPLLVMTKVKVMLVPAVTLLACATKVTLRSAAGVTESMSTAVQVVVLQPGPVLLTPEGAASVTVLVTVVWAKLNEGASVLAIRTMAQGKMRLRKWRFSAHALMLRIALINQVLLFIAVSRITDIVRYIPSYANVTQDKVFLTS